MNKFNDTPPLRHGDMFFKKVDPSAVKGLKRKSRTNLTVGLGEVSGHAHNIKPFEGGEVIELASESEFENEAKDKNAFIERPNSYFEVAGTGAVVHHEDHEPIIFPAGTYVRIHQKVYSTFEDEIKKVVD